jgi:hypothetical protein
MKQSPIERDIKKAEEKDIRGDYNIALKEIQALRKELGAFEKMADHEGVYQVKGAKNPKSQDATAVAVASDWHVEEKVDPKKLNGLNSFDLKEADKRIDKFANGVLHHTEVFKGTYDIKNLVLALLGDFISGHIHDELKSNTELAPVDAILWVQDRIRGVIKHILDNSNLNITVPTCQGNHPRLSDKVNHSNEAGNSLEYMMYKNLSHIFESEKRVAFLVSEAYHQYVNIYDKTLRFSHGHNIRYAGGVGGIFIPAYKAIAQWNKAVPFKVDNDIFAHFHQLKDGGNFISNGSLIGYSPYALSIKADYEPPRQAFFVMNNKEGKIAQMPINLT